MSEKETIKNAIREIAKGNSSFNTIIGKVIKGSVSGIFCDVKPLDGAELKKVRLNGHTEGLIITPADDSFVFVTLLNENDAFVSKFSTIQKIGLDVKGDIIINGGKNEGLVKIKELTDKLNALKTSVNDLISAYNSHTHSVSTTGTAAAQTGTAAVIVSKVLQAAAFNKTDYENTKIKH